MGKPFNKLMSDVVFVISGIQNPLRSDIRQKALGKQKKNFCQIDSIHKVFLAMQI